jgi:hypothetical protein
MLGREWVCASTSEFLIGRLAHKLGEPVHRIRENKQDYRRQLQSLGGEYDKKEPGGVAKMALLDAQAQATGVPKGIILQSVRRPSEVWYLSKFQNVTFLKIDASEATRRVRRGKLVGSDHITESDILKDVAHILIPNNGTLEELKVTLQKAIQSLDI